MSQIKEVERPRNVEQDCISVAFQIIQARKNSLYNIRKISKVSGLSPDKVDRLIQFYKLGNRQAEKSEVRRSITSVANLESILGLKEEGIAKVLEVNNRGQDFDNSDATKEFNITFSFAFL